MNRFKPSSVHANETVLQFGQWQVELSLRSSSLIQWIFLEGKRHAKPITLNDKSRKPSTVCEQKFGGKSLG